MVVSVTKQLSCLGDVMVKKVVLLVDDNELNRKVISKIVESVGYDVVMAGSGVEALQIYNHDKPDLILMDCRMPDMDGFDTTRIIRQIERVNEMKRIPVVAVTADDKSDEWERCVDAGMDDFIAKPVDVSKLADIIQKYTAQESVSDNIDVAALMVSADNDPGWALDLLKMFAEDTLQRLEEIRNMKELKRFCADDALRHFHTIKSSAASVGAKTLSELAKKMENHVRNSELTTVFDKISEVDVEFERACESLKQEIVRKINEKS